jgi:hypothetical protein
VSFFKKIDVKIGAKKCNDVHNIIDNARGFIFASENIIISVSLDCQPK